MACIPLVQSTPTLIHDSATIETTVLQVIEVEDLRLEVAGIDRHRDVTVRRSLVVTESTGLHRGKDLLHAA